MKFSARMARNSLGQVFASYWQVFDQDGNIVADLYGEKNKQDEDGNDLYLPDEKIAEYACLLATAPDLLVALKECVTDLESEIKYKYGNPPLHPSLQNKYNRDMWTVNKARAAIKKAVGQRGE